MSGKDLVTMSVCSHLGSQGAKIMLARLEFPAEGRIFNVPFLHGPCVRLIWS